MSDKVMFISESVIASVVKDAITIGGLAVMAWFNHRFCGGSGWINAAIALGWVAMLCQMSAKRRTPDEARRWLDKQYPPTESQS